MLICINGSIIKKWKNEKKRAFEKKKYVYLQHVDTKDLCPYFFQNTKCNLKKYALGLEFI